MTQISFRALLAPAAIGVSIIVSMKLYLVQPMKNRLEQTRLQAQVMADDTAQLSNSALTLDQLRDRQEVADHRLDEIALAGKIVHNEGLLFQRISDISVAAQVSLERLDPQPVTNHASDTSGITSLRCSIEAIGSYGAIAMFVHDLERRLGITIVRSVHIAPVQGGDDKLVLANIETEHFSINPRAGVAEGGAQ